jgi:hypothetical protein
VSGRSSLFVAQCFLNVSTSFRLLTTLTERCYRFLIFRFSILLHVVVFADSVLVKSRRKRTNSGKRNLFSHLCLCDRTFNRFPLNRGDAIVFAPPAVGFGLIDLLQHWHTVLVIPSGHTSLAEQEYSYSGSLN